MFEIGEQVEYLGEARGKYKVIVVSSTPLETRCQFYSLGVNGYKEGHYFGSYSFPTSKFERMAPPLTTEEKVLKKIKLLDQRFAERQAQKAKEKENANKVVPPRPTLSISTRQSEWQIFGTAYVNTSYTTGRV